MECAWILALCLLRGGTCGTTHHSSPALEIKPRACPLLDARCRGHDAETRFRADDSRTGYCSSDTPRLLAAARQTWASSRWRRANSWRLVGGSSAPAASMRCQVTGSVPAATHSFE